MRHPDETDRPITKKERVRFAGALAVVLTIAALATQAGCDLQPPPLADAAGAFYVPVPRAPTETAAYVMKQDLKIISQMQADYPSVEATISFLPCDEENGYYQPGEHSIRVCAEDLEYPAWSVQVAAHEFGHAVTDELADITDENAADEIAILAMARHGWFDEMLGAAEYMRTHWPAEHMHGDEHPGGAYREWELVCAEDGAEGLADPRRPASSECDAFYRGLVAKWDHRIPRAGDFPRF